MIKDEVLALSGEELDWQASLLAGTDLSEYPEHEFAELGCDQQEYCGSVFHCKRCGFMPGWVWEEELAKHKSGPCQRSAKKYTQYIAMAWELFESVYDPGGKIKGGAWVLGTVEGGRDVASACLIWKEKSFTKFRPLKVTVIRPRGEMAKAITQAWVCGMLGLSDVM